MCATYERLKVRNATRAKTPYVPFRQKSILSRLQFFECKFVKCAYNALYVNLYILDLLFRNLLQNEKLTRV